VEVEVGWVGREAGGVGRMGGAERGVMDGKRVEGKVGMVGRLENGGKG